MIDIMPSAATDEPVACVLRPNCSLSWRGSLLVLALIALPSLTAAIGFAALGYWLVLPFVGLELLALAVCLYMVSRRCHSREVILIGPETVRVELGIRRPQHHIEFERSMTRAWLEGEGRARQLVVAARGQVIEVGHFLTDHERVALLGTLKHLLRSGAPRTSAGEPHPCP